MRTKLIEVVTMALMRKEFKQKQNENEGSIKNFFPSKDIFDNLFGLGLDKLNREKTLSMEYSKCTTLASMRQSEAIKYSFTSKKKNPDMPFDVVPQQTFAEDKSDQEDIFERGSDLRTYSYIKQHSNNKGIKQQDSTVGFQNQLSLDPKAAENHMLAEGRGSFRHSPSRKQKMPQIDEEPE